MSNNITDEDIKFNEEEYYKNKPTNVKLFALENRKYKYCVPSKLNTFGCIKVDHVMVSPSCNSLMIPLKTTNDIDLLLNKYPQENYWWRIIKSTKMLDLLILVIETNNTHFDIIIGEDLPIVFNTKVNKLSFPLNEELSKYLLELCQKKKLALEKNSLNYLTLFPYGYTHELSIANYVIVGQPIIKDLIYIQNNHACAIFDIGQITSRAGYNWNNMLSDLMICKNYCYDAH